MHGEVVVLGMTAPTVVVIGAWMTSLLSRRSAALRNSLWRIALLALWVVPGAVLVNDRVQIESLTVQVPVPAAMQHIARETRAAPEVNAPGSASRPVAPATVEPEMASQPFAPGAGLGGVLLWVWAGGAVLAAGLLLRDLVLARRLVRASILLDDPALAGRVAHLCARMGLERSPALGVSEQVGVPTVFGLRRAVLLLPRGLSVADAGSDAVIVHELAHIRRGDLAAQMAARATLALLWWNPFVWLVAHGLATSAEEACDDWAVALTGRREQYAAALVRWAEKVASVGGLAYAYQGKALVRRVKRALTERGVPKLRLSRRARAALAICGVLAMAAAGSLRLQRARAQGDWAGVIDRAGVKLCYEAGVDEAYLEPIADVVSLAKRALEDLFPELAKESVEVYVRPALNWYENTVTDRRSAIHIRLGPKGLGEVFRGDAGPVGILCQAVAELYNPARLPGLDRYVTHRYLVSAVTDELGPGILPQDKATPLAEDGVAMLQLLTDDIYTLVHPDLAAAAALVAIEDRPGLDGLLALLPTIAEDAPDPFASLRETAVAMDQELEAAFDAYDAANALAVQEDGTCLIASFEEDEAVTSVRSHPLSPFSDHVALVVGGPFEISQSDEWAKDGTSSLRLELQEAWRWPNVRIDDPDWRFKDWRRFAKFEMDLMIESEQAQNLYVLACDDSARGHGRIILFRGRVQPDVPLHISYPLDQATLRGRKTYEGGYFSGSFRAAEVASLEVQLVDPTLPVTLYLDNLRLTPRAEGTLGLLPARAVEPGPVIVKGTVAKPDGQPAAGAEVGVLGQWRGANSFDEVFTDEAFAVTADDEGHFELELAVERGMMVGAWSVWARDGDLIRAVILQELEALHQPIEIPLAEGGYVKIRTLDPEGQPLASIETWIALTDGPAALIGGPKSDEHGDVIIGPLPAYVGLRIQPPHDAVHLALNDAWWSGEAGEITLAPGEVYELEPLRLNLEGRTVTGSVHDENGEPVAGAKVATFRPIGSTNEVLTDEQGRFTLTRLAVHGDVWLLASHPTESLYAARKVDPDAGEEVTLTLRPPTSVSGHVVDAEGRAVGNAEVQEWRMVRLQEVIGKVHTLWRAPWIPQSDPTTTDADGFFRIEGLVSGAPYSVSIKAPGLRFDGTQTEFIADADNPVDLGIIRPRE